jgi:aspartyl-tRNA(Asn)/glutamyl-tRNA(Gln) amidotransferase subunit A
MLEVLAEDHKPAPPVEKPRIGIARRPFFDDLDPEIEIAFEAALKEIRLFSSAIKEIDLPSAPAAVQAPEVYALHAKHFAATPEKYGRWMQERLKQAAAVDIGAYVQARQELENLRRVIEDVFREVDFVLTPTTPVPPITINEALNMSPDPAGELWLRNTRPFNAYGVPTISVPCGFTRAGLPIGLQIMGASFGEASLLSFAHAYEQSTQWHKRTPALS